MPPVRLLLSALLAVTALFAQTATRDLRVRRVTQPLPDKRTRWAVVIGVSSYKYAPPKAQLKFAHRDAAEFARLLRSPEGGGFAPSNIRLLTQDSATVGGIRAAIHGWLPASAGPNDIVYLFFAGHAVVEDNGDSYFVAHDSDPQNLHATGIPFQEVNDALTSKTRAASVVLIADACHAGGIGWTSDPTATPTKAQTLLEAFGAKEGPAKDRSFLKLLASKPSEQSFEDPRWGGGHGVFTYTLLTALRGAGDRDRDGFVRASELIDYVSSAVPKQTEAKQNPRVAGNFDAAMPMAAVPMDVRRPAPQAASLRVTGPPASPVYLDREYRGSIRPTGDLVIETEAGARMLSVDLPNAAVERQLMLQPGPNTLDLTQAAEDANEAALKSMIVQGNLLGPNGAVQKFQGQKFATPLLMAALEDTAMECVSDYVQSTTNSLKRAMFLRSAGAFQELRTLRPADTAALEAKMLFCQARAHIAANEFEQAADALGRSIAIDGKFACSYNALGVALGRLGRMEGSRKAFEIAARLAPDWALPPLDIARQMIAAGDLRGAVPHLEKAMKLNPQALGIQWTLARAHRLLGNGPDFLGVANAAIAADRNYAPVYAEMGMYFEAAKAPDAAAQAYDSYLLLAPNFADSAEVRKRVQAIRNPAPPPPPPPAKAPPPEPRKPPTLRRESDKKKR